MDLNFDEIGELGEYEPVPEGTYTCRVAKVEEKQTRHGHDMWTLRLEIEDGEFAGRSIFDRMVFSKAALPRAKMIFNCLGIDTRGSRAVTPDTIIGRRCRVEAVIKSYADDDGVERFTNKVPFEGYAPVDDDGLPH
jgi:hypothetical protein